MTATSSQPWLTFTGPVDLGPVSLGNPDYQEKWGIAVHATVNLGTTTRTAILRVSIGSAPGTGIGFQSYETRIDQFGLAARSIVGKVTDSGGLPLSGVVVNLTGTQSLTTTTAQNGWYQFNSLQSGGNYTVTPSPNGFYTPLNKTFTNLTASVSADFVKAGYDLTVVKVEPVQVTYPNRAPIELVKNKPTAVRFTIHVDNLQNLISDPGLQYIRVNLDFSGDPGSYTYTINRSDFAKFDSGNDFTGIYDSPPILPQNTSSGFVEAAVTAVGGSEINTSNNFASRATLVEARRPLKLLFVAIGSCDTPFTTCYAAPTVVQATKQVSDEFIKAVFPIDPSQYTSDFSQSSVIGSSDQSRDFFANIYGGIPTNGIEADLATLNALAQYPLYDAVIGVVTPSYFKFHLLSDSKHLYKGASMPSVYPHAAIVTESSTTWFSGGPYSINYDGATTAHELGHLFGLKHDGDQQNLHFTGNKQNGWGLMTSGYWVTNVEVSKRSRDFMYCIMGNGRLRGYAWIDQDHYNLLFDAFSIH